MKNVLFPLLRLGLDNSTTDEENLSGIIIQSAKKWDDLGDLAREQGVLGFLMDGVEKLEGTRYGATRELKLDTKLEWIGEVLQMEQINRQQICVMNELAERWKQNGCRVMVMKGQANAITYPRPEHRSSGDIDCYLFGKYLEGNDIAREAGISVDDSWYKHSIIDYKGETFENHQYFVHTREGKRSKMLEKELEEALNVDESEFKPLSESTVIPPVQWTAMFLTYHACAHFLIEGLKLKQVLDWAMFLKAHQNDVDWNAFYSFCGRYHLKRFADAITAICCEYLGIKIANADIESKSAYSEKILKSVLYDDDYIYGQNTGWGEKWHVLKNLFRYRWKYNEIYEESIWKQLWYYSTGYIFKTES